MHKYDLNFGQIIAYLIPGFLALYPLGDFIPFFQALLGQQGIPSAEALIPLLLLALAVGIVINAFSWALLSPLFAFCGVKRPKSLTYTTLTKDNIEIYNVIVEANFRYYQFYSNVLVAILLYAPKWLVYPMNQNLWRNGTFVLIVGVLFIAARDSLNRAYTRMIALSKKEVSVMTNGDPGPNPDPDHTRKHDSKEEEVNAMTDADPKHQKQHAHDQLKLRQTTTLPQKPQ